MKKFNKIILFTISILPCICPGQEGPDFLGFIPNTTPPSPNTYEFGKFGHVPVGLYTGSVNFNLPLYTYKTKHLSVPISLQYNSNGIKVDQIESAVGLGWSLNAGGVITTIARNRSDELAYCMYPPVEIDNIYQNGAAEFFDLVGNWGGDAEPDLYIFNFMGYSGKFVYDKDHNIVLMPLQNLKIEENGNDGFTITCSDGVKYNFNEQETVIPRLCCYNPPPPQGEETINAWYLSEIVHPYGDKIKFEYVNDNFICTTAVSQTYTALDPPGQTACGSYETNDPGARGPYYHKSINTCKSLTRIYSDCFGEPGEVEEPGEVLFSSTYPSPTSPGYMLINSISIRNRYNNEIERFEFNYTTYQSNHRVFLEDVQFKDPTKYYHMDYINPDFLPERLSFAQDHWGYYNGATSNVNFYPEIPDNVFFSGINGANKEPNGEYSVFGLLHKITYPTKGYSEVFYEPNDYYGLKHIPGQYTTVGLYVETGEDGWGSDYADETVIESVADQYIRIIVNVADVYNPGGEECSNEPTGHARARFTVTDNSTGLTVPLLVYYQGYGYVPRGSDLFSPDGTDNTCYAYLDNNISYTLTLTPITSCMTASASIKYLEIAPYEYYTNIETGGQRINRTVDHEPVTGNNEITRYFYYQKDNPEKSCGVEGQKAMYITPTVIQIQCTPYIQEPIYYKVLGASSLCQLFNTHNNNIYYPNVTVSIGGDNFENGGELHEFFNNEDVHTFFLWGEEILEAPWTNTGWKTGLENKSTVFRKDNNGNKTVLKETTNEYTTYQNESIAHVSGYSVRKKYDYLIGGPGYIANLDIRKYQNYSYWKYPTSSTMTLYDENGLNPISITNNYFYDNITHLQLTRTESETSGGENKITKYFYPDDLPSFPYKTELLEQYRIGEKIKEQEYLGTKLVSTKLITYNDWGNNIIHPALLETSIYENPLEPMERFYNISSTGTPQEFSKEDDIHTAIIWGYQDTKPVIKGENINYPDLLVAVNLTISDFEQLLSPGGIGDLTSPTQRDAWKDFNRTLRSQSLLTNSLITTYTYKSLVGLTSSTDPNGVTTYYEYDGFGRLIYIRDNSYSILKKYDYHYKE